MSGNGTSNMSAKEIFDLAINYYFGTDVKKNKEKAAELFEEAANAGYKFAINNLAFMYKNGDGVKKDTEKAVMLLQQAADAGNGNAAYDLAEMYFKADSVPLEMKKSAQLLQQSVDANHPTAAYNLALMNYDGIHIEKNKQKAAILLQKSVDLGNAKAAYNLAVMYQTGDYFEQDLQQAAVFYQKSMDLGYDEAINNLAMMYKDGEGVEQNLDKAFALCQQGAKLNNSNATNNLAVMYKNGDGISKDLKKAVKLFQQAVKLGNSNAMNTLAGMYRNGNGVIKNMDQAVDLLQQASTLDNLDAIYNLALIYSHDDILKDRKKSISLFTEAAGKGHARAALHMPHKLIAQLFNKLDKLDKLEDNFLELEDTIRAIKERHIYTKKSPLAHFTSWPAIENIIPETAKENNVLRLYNVDYMNDPTEGRSLMNVKSTSSENSNVFLNDIFENTIFSNETNTINSVPPSIYSLYFTESSDRLDLWRAYGNDGDGFSIVTTFPSGGIEEISSRQTLDTFAKHIDMNDIQKNHLNTQPNTPPILFHVFYDDKNKLKTIERLNIPLKKIEDKLSKLNEVAKNEIYYVLYATLLEVMYLYKDEQYSTEREVRVIQAMSLDDVKLDERKPGRLYCETTPFLFKNASSKIVIGPKVQDRRVALWNLRYRLKKNGFGDTTSVVFSDVNYR